MLAAAPRHSPEPGRRDRRLRALRGDIEVRLIVHYAQEWRDGRPSTQAYINQLQREQGFTAKRALRFRTVFDQCFDIIRAIEP
jgi:hypothetical protein